MTSLLDRRRLLTSGLSLAGASALPLLGAPSIAVAASARPQAASGIQLGDLSLGRVMLWSRADMPARLHVEVAFDENFSGAQRLRGPLALETSDFTARIDLQDLPADRQVFVRAWFENLDNARATSEPVLGRFRTPARKRGVRFVWGGDTAGQGWGINPSFGGMKIYEQMRRVQPDFFLHSGDTIYADGPITSSVNTPQGLWTNLVTPEVAKVAETLDEFRGRYRYNLMDENLRRFNAEVPQIWQWDDHEVTNNWNDDKSVLNDARYTEKNLPLLTARGTRAFLDYAPLRPHSADESERVYRHIPYGPLLDVFVLDMRSYRGPNTANLQTSESALTPILGKAQVEWLKRSLKHSKATWKVIASDMPIGLNVGDGRDAAGAARWEAVANGNDGAAAGRELEIAGLLQAIKRMGIRNTVWLTADVHYCAAHYYDPNQARFSDFDGFWEFVAGPLNAGSFGPNTLDATFGPRVDFQKAPPAGQSNLSPYAGLQFFGEVSIDPHGRTFSVAFKDLNGATVYSRTLQPG